MADLRIMTFNILFSNFNDEGIAKIILTHTPDLVALQEVQPDMMLALEERLAHSYPYAQLGNEHSYGTTAIFSRFPISNVQILDLEADRPAVAVDIIVKGQRVTFISSHLLAYGLQWVAFNDIPHAVQQRTVAQNRQAQILIDYVTSQNGSVVLGCDCNSHETSSSYRLLTRVLQNAARFTGWNWIASKSSTLLPDNNLQHIDFVLYTDQLEPVRTHRVRHTAGSDHRPIVVDFRLQ
ncbi:MAG: hypothetical protein GY805_26590 [Chloroflexi bacterium]|nr:hypothetical protein [Chloroflexota bacterium]